MLFRSPASRHMLLSRIQAMHVSEYPDGPFTQRICEWLIKFSNHPPDGAMSEGSGQLPPPLFAKWITLLTGWLIRASKGFARQPCCSWVSVGRPRLLWTTQGRQLGLHRASPKVGHRPKAGTCCPTDATVDRKPTQDRRQSNGSFGHTDDSGPPCLSNTPAKAERAATARLLRDQTNFCPIS